MAFSPFGLKKNSCKVARFLDFVVFRDIIAAIFRGGVSVSQTREKAKS